MDKGRPAKYKTPEELQEAINTYFESGANERIVHAANSEYRVKAYSVTGLALFLGFNDRQSIYDYKNRSDDFSCIIKKAITRIAQYYEENLTFGKSPTGAIYWLNVHGWNDNKKDNDQSNKDININIHELINLDGLSLEELAVAKKILSKNRSNDDTNV